MKPWLELLELMMMQKEGFLIYSKLGYNMDHIIWFIVYETSE